MKECITSDGFVTLAFDTGKIRFGLSGRAWDEVGHDMFAVQLPNRPLLYGEWRQKWADNRNDFDAEVVDFGLFDRGNAGSPHPNHRQALTRRERTVVEDLVRKLFASTEAKKGVSNFSVRGSTFLGHVYFLPGWIRELEATA
jgi:hypothetical protein